MGAPDHALIDLLGDHHHQRLAGGTQAVAQRLAVQEPADKVGGLAHEGIGVGEHVAGVHGQTHPEPLGVGAVLVVGQQLLMQAARHRVEQQAAGDVGVDREEPAVAGVLQHPAPGVDAGAVEQGGAPVGQVPAQPDADAVGSFDPAVALDVGGQEGAVAAVPAGPNRAATIHNASHPAGSSICQPPIWQVPLDGGSGRQQRACTESRIAWSCLLLASRTAGIGSRSATIAFKVV